jgi:Phytanoyl-CoA dioxygenase (PhyH)
VDVDAFIRDGYVAIRGAVDEETTVACRELIWAAMERRGVRREDRATWPVLLEMDDLAGAPFAAAGSAPALVAACDELIGPGRWSPLVHVGEALVVRFPAPDDERANAGYHIEGSYAGPRPGEYWVNVRSRARGLLALFLFTDVGPDDAPTRLMRGSHLYPPEFLAPYGEAGTNSDADFWRPSILCLPVAHATGRAGDVFLCHPFIVHTATWPHRGSGPRMLGQPAVYMRDGFALDGTDPSPVARAIVAGLELTGTQLPSGAGSPGRRPPG